MSVLTSSWDPNWKGTISTVVLFPLDVKHIRTVHRKEKSFSCPSMEAVNNSFATTSPYNCNTTSCFGCLCATKQIHTWENWRRWNFFCDMEQTATLHSKNIHPFLLLTSHNNIIIYHTHHNKVVLPKIRTWTPHKSFLPVLERLNHMTDVVKIP